MKNKPVISYKIFSLIGLAAVFVLLILYMGGFFRSGLIEPGIVKRTGDETPPPGRTGYAAVENITEWYEAVGTVRSRTETYISARITGRIIKISVRPGDKVKKGDPLIYLDNREIQARLDQAEQGLHGATAKKEQAEQGLVSARAVFTQAESNYKRIKRYLEQEAATKKDLEEAESSYRQAKAGVKQAQKGMVAAEAGVQRAKKIVEEVGVSLEYTKITAHETGEVANRLAEPGDLAWPGKSLLVLQAPGSLRLEAYVREGLIKKVVPGAQLQVVINAIDKRLKGRVEEVIPSADPLSRTFLVKAAIPAVSGLYPGMFGRLLVPQGKRQTVVVPRNAVYHIGQMEIVKVERDGRWYDCFVKTGKDINDRVEILSGLTGKEKISLRMDSDE